MSSATRYPAGTPPAHQEVPPFKRQWNSRYDLSPPEVRKILAENGRLRRSLRALTAGLKQLEWFAEECGRMRLNRPDLAVLHARHAAFEERFAGLPLCELERDMIQAQGVKAFALLLAYTVVKPAVERQLSAMRRDQSPTPAPV